MATQVNQQHAHVPAAMQVTSTVQAGAEQELAVVTLVQK
jgi:hypothetical protein